MIYFVHSVFLSSKFSVSSVSISGIEPEMDASREFRRFSSFSTPSAYLADCKRTLNGNVWSTNYYFDKRQRDLNITKLDLTCACYWSYVEFHLPCNEHQPTKGKDHDATRNR